MHVARTGIPSRFLVFALAAVFCLSGALRGLAAEQASEPKYFVDVPLATLEQARVLEANGFDIAGINHHDRTAGVIATADELARLTQLGFSYVIREEQGQADQVAALSD